MKLQSLLDYQYNDGGNQRNNDCAARALAIATGYDHKYCYRLLQEYTKDLTGGLVRGISTGVYTPVLVQCAMDEFNATVHPYSGYLGLDHCAPRDVCIASTTRHFLAIIEDTVHDTWDSRYSTRTRNGLARLEGYIVFDS